MRKATFVRSAWRELVCSAMRRRERGFYVTIYKKSAHCVRYRVRDATYDDDDDSLAFGSVRPREKIFSSHLLDFSRFLKLHLRRRYRGRGLLLRLDCLIESER